MIQAQNSSTLGHSRLVQFSHSSHFNRLPLLGLLAAVACGWAIPVSAQSYLSGLLQPSDQGESVAELQQNLARLGYYNASVTGNFDAATQAAVVQFQQANGLTADGIVGAATQAALSGGSSAPSVTSPSPAAGDSTNSNNSVSALQQQLVQLGYYSGTVTGLFDDATQAAVISFQRARGLAADGIVGPETEAALYQSPASADSSQSAEAVLPETAPSGTTYAAASTTVDFLQLGDSGSAVSDLQSRLQTLGYYNGPISGSFGSQTQVALTAFQQAQGLTADGIAGPQVNAALASASIPAVAPTVPATPALSPATPAPQTAVAPTMPAVPAITPVAPAMPIAPAIPSASVQVPGLPPAMPELSNGLSNERPAQVEPESSSPQGGRFSVTELQRRLQLNGFDPAEMTGEYDPATQSAVNQAQQSYGLSSQDFGN